jgi:S1-C subfamily serine protease
LGAGAAAAVKSFQRRIGARETGVLSREDRAALAAQAKAKQEEVGWRLIDDATTGVRVGVPLKLAPQMTVTENGSRWRSSRGEVQVETFRMAEAGTSLNAVFEQQKRETNRKVDYSVIRPDFYVLSGMQGLKRFYQRAAVKGTDVRGMTILYDQALDGTMGPVALVMSNVFVGFPTTVAGPIPKPKVAYGTAIVIDAAGHVLADRDVVEGCHVITVAGLGNADLVADDKAADLALLRLYGARNLISAAASDAPASGEIKLVGIADPQAQGGADAVITLAALVGPENSPLTLEPIPVAGFSGAAAVDAQGRLVGIAQIRSQMTAGAGPPLRAALVPVTTIRAFLATRQVALAASTDAIDIRPAIKRVICVRK